jgi:hypothetical protein
MSAQLPSPAHEDSWNEATQSLLGAATVHGQASSGSAADGPAAAAAPDADTRKGCRFSPSAAAGPLMLSPRCGAATAAAEAASAAGAASVGLRAALVAAAATCCRALLQPASWPAALPAMLRMWRRCCCPH